MTYLYPYAQNVLPGVETERSGMELAAITQLRDQGLIPEDFPTQLWAAQAERYRTYWAWFRGDKLNELQGTSSDGKPVYKYPLKINPVRNFTRKHAALLFGEVPDTPTPLVKHVVTPKSFGENPSEADKKQALFYQTFLNEVWQGSYGRSVQYENGLISQFLGGSVFQTQYQPWRNDLLIPLVQKRVFPDFFLPIWSNDDPWNLLAAYVVYRVPAAAVKLQWGIDSGDKPYMLYFEHWTRDRYTILLDGKPLVASFRGTRVNYDNVPNPFGLVPFTYIPRWREGNFYGSTFVEDIDGLILEYNARFADLGDGVRNNIHRLYVGRNIQNTPRVRQFDNGRSFTDLGHGIPGSNHEPELKAIDAPEWTEGFVATVENIWRQLGRESGLGPIAFGEDEGSQRSALTLAFRMWPSTISARAQRVFWTDGLNHIAKTTLTMASKLGLKVKGKVVPEDFWQGFDFACDWLPMIPRDREAQVNEIILRLQAGAISLEKALQDFGDVPDVQKEIQQIKAFQQWQAELHAQPAKPGTSANSGALESTQKPVVRDSLNE